MRDNGYLDEIISRICCSLFINYMNREGHKFLTDFITNCFDFIKPSLEKMEIDITRFPEEMQENEKITLAQKNEKMLRSACLYIIESLFSKTSTIPPQIKRVLSIIRKELKYFQRAPIRNHEKEEKEIFHISLNDLRSDMDSGNLFEIYQCLISKEDLKEIEEQEPNLSLKVISTLVFLRFILPGNRTF